MYPAKIDVAVLLLFFARPEQTRLVFEQIKKARPSQLFLYQDGARVGRNDDIEGIAKCEKLLKISIGIVRYIVSTKKKIMDVTHQNIFLKNGCSALSTKELF